MQKKESVWCKFSVDGLHNWAGIPDTPELSDVQYLKNLHRHMFGFKCFKEVGHSDRDTEFIHLKHDIMAYLEVKYWDNNMRSHVFGSQSCEMLADELCQAFELYRCEVDEDGENGGVVEYI